MLTYQKRADLSNINNHNFYFKLEKAAKIKIQISTINNENKMNKPLEQELTNFLCKDPGSEYFRLCRQYLISVAYSSLFCFFVFFSKHFQLIVYINEFSQRLIRRDTERAKSYSVAQKFNNKFVSRIRKELQITKKELQKNPI